MDISNNLKNFFENKKLDNVTAVSVANKINISKKTLSNYINGDAYIPLEHLNSIANIFNVSVDYILGLSKKENYPHNKNIKDIDKTLVGARLKKFRQEKKLTQTKLADELQVNKSTISKYENSKNLILTIYLYIICKNYKISADYLLGRIDKLL